MKTVLCISSQTVAGTIASGVNSFILQCMGHRVWTIPTSLNSNHGGHPHALREPVRDETVEGLIANLEANGWLVECDAVLTGRRVRIRHKEGQLHIETLLPESAKIKLIGGPGKEYFCDGRNWPPKKKRDPLAGAWRVEVSPTNPAAADTFLHVLAACDRLADPPPTCRLLPKREGIGVEITTAKDSWTVRFTSASVIVSLTRGGRAMLRNRALLREIQKQTPP